MKKKIALLMACVMAFGVAVGGTLAWLTDSTEEVKNTFTDSDINIELTETFNKDSDDADTEPDYWEKKMVPGYTIEKDPIVTVKAGSEDCWVFIKVDASENANDYLEWKIDPNNWEALDETQYPGVYYCYAKDLIADRSIKVLGYEDSKGEFHPNEVKVKDTVTKAMMETAKTDQPTLTFTAYATQLMKNNTEEFTAAQAWANIQTELNPPANP